MTASARVPLIVGVTGASGTPYAAAVLRGVLAAGVPVDLVVSRAARLTLLDETGIAWHDDAGSLREWLAASLDPGLPFSGAQPSIDDVRFWSPGDLAAGPSSGSYVTRGMVVVPASTAAVAGIAIGLSKDLLQRAADVTLKERRPLVVVPREMPLTAATLRHLVTLDASGAVVMPASPAFYSKPKSMQQLVDFVAGKVLDVLGVEHDLFTRWDGRLANSANSAGSANTTHSAPTAPGQ
jgi:4-hydroxy-3-polyprenylbenzoate decarboxylase